MFRAGMMRSVAKAFSLNRSARQAVLLTVGMVAARTCVIPAVTAQVLPSPVQDGPKFAGPTSADAPPVAWPQNPTAPSGAPNVLIVMTDDVGFGASSAFGGPIPTPHLEALAKRGAVYNQFNTTALCSPTRAALLTGREPHNVGMATVTNLPQGYDGYNSVLPKSAGALPEILRQNGYSTAMFGKSHLIPEWEMSAAGPFDRWPTGLGFEYFYGFLSGDTSQFEPVLYENTLPVADPRQGRADYILDGDLTDRAITWINAQKAVAPDKPFFLYYASGTAHAPQHAPKEWLEKFRGKFSYGWDALRQQTFSRQKAMGIIPAGTRLTGRPGILPAWSTLSDEQKEISQRFMEAYAAQLSYFDNQFGRLIEDLKKNNQFDNTLIIFIEGDNGSSAEGGIAGRMSEQSFVNFIPEDSAYVKAHAGEIGGYKAYNMYPAGWAWALNAPFQYFKQVASHFGGTRNGLVISWPGHIAAEGAVRSQYHHVSDIMPTVLEAVKIQPPAILNGIPQKPIDGISMSYTFNTLHGPSRRRTQVYEMAANFGVYHDGWFAGTTPYRAPWEIGKQIGDSVSGRRWELYNIADDFSQSRDLAKSNPGKLTEMQRLFWVEAGRNAILPIHKAPESMRGKPNLNAGRSEFIYRSGVTHVPESAAPALLRRSFTIAAKITVPEGGGNGVIVTQGGRFGGYALYLKDGRPVFHYNATGPAQSRIAAAAVLTPGDHEIVVRFRIDSDGDRMSPGEMSILVDSHQVATGRITMTLPNVISQDEGFDIGIDTGSPISDDYAISQSKFVGSVNQVIFELY